jgi:hypothetical protein
MRYKSTVETTISGDALDACHLANLLCDLHVTTTFTNIRIVVVGRKE